MTPLFDAATCPYVDVATANTVKSSFFRVPGKFAKITDHENLNTVAFQCSRKQKR